jgi:hypothetical protein
MCFGQAALVVTWPNRSEPLLRTVAACPASETAARQGIERHLRYRGASWFSGTQMLMAHVCTGNTAAAAAIYSGFQTPNFLHTHANHSALGHVFSRAPYETGRHGRRASADIQHLENPVEKFNERATSLLRPVVVRGREPAAFDLPPITFAHIRDRRGCSRGMFIRGGIDAFRDIPEQPFRFLTCLVRCPGRAVPSDRDHRGRPESIR